MNIIDFHTHVYPDRLAERATQATCDFYGLDAAAVGNVEQLLACGAAAGISKYVLLPVAVHPTGVRHVNQFVVELVQKYEAFYGYGTVHPDMKNVMAELEYIRASGLRGLKLHPDMQRVDTDDERLFAVYEWLSDTGLPLLVHCGDRTRDFSHPRHLRRVLDHFPRLTVIAAHLGGWSRFDTAFEYLKDTDCYLDISSCMAFLPPAEVARYIRGYGAHRILFGTDFPVGDMKREVEMLQALPLTEGEKEQIAYKNALRLLGM